MRDTLLKLGILLWAIGSAFQAYAGKVIQEEEHVFLKKYSGQSKQFVTENLGKPVKTEISVKPYNAENVLQEKQVQIDGNKEFIEMWYYDAKIQYAPNKFFSRAELTFADGKCVNITFANIKK